MGARSRRLVRRDPARRAPTCRSRSTVGLRDGRVERPFSGAREVGRMSPYEDRFRTADALRESGARESALIALSSTFRDLEHEDDLESRLTAAHALLRRAAVFG